MKIVLVSFLLMFYFNSGHAQFVFSTFLGGNTLDNAKVCFIDSLGRVFVGGAVSDGFYTSINTIDSTYNGGSSDIGIAVFSANGDSVLFSTYLGGSDWEEVYGMDIDAEGNLVIAGRTRSKDFPVSAGVFQDTAAEGMNAFVAKIDFNTGDLLFSSFIGPGNAHCLKILSNEQIVVAGITESPNFPVTPGAFSTSFTGELDAFVSILSKNGDSLIYSTFFGSEKWDRVNGLDVDNDDNIYVAGFSEGNNFPQPTSNNLDKGKGYLVKFNPQLDSIFYLVRVQSTIWDMVLDKRNNQAILIGVEWRSDFKYTTNAYRDSAIGGLDVMITKIDTEGNNIINGTFFGGYADEFGLGIDVDNQGRVYIAGRASGTIPVTPLAINGFHHSGLFGIDAFAAVFSQDLKHLEYSTLIGEWREDIAWDIRCNNNGEFVVVGETKSPAFQISQNAFQDTINGGFDFFITKLNLFQVNNIDPFSEETDIKLYPNPSNGKITVADFPSDNFEYFVIGMDGKMVLSGKGLSNQAINLMQCQSGIYALILFNEKYKSTHKIVIHH